MPVKSIQTFKIRQTTSLINLNLFIMNVQVVFSLMVFYVPWSLANFYSMSLHCFKCLVKLFMTVCNVAIVKTVHAELIVQKSL